MKVLWLSNNPALGIDYLFDDYKLVQTGGWLYALNREIQTQIDLSIAFFHPYNQIDFKYEGTNYYPIHTGNILIENLKRRFFNKVYDNDFITEYLRIIELTKPDVIHIHGTENPFLCLLKHTNIPIVISIQGNLTVYHHKFLSGFNGKFLRHYENNFGLKALVLGRNNFNRNYNEIKTKSKIERKYFKFSKNVIGRTDWDKRISRILAPDSAYYLADELLRDTFYQTNWNNFYKEGRLIIFTTNGDNYYKGFETICFALKLLLDLNIEIEWRVAGIHNHSLINRITKKFLKQNYPKTSLKLLGSLNEQEIIDNLLESHIYVMPSHIENSPNNLCEAMIIGMPCIATFAGGTGSMLKDGEDGILIQDGDPWAMAGAIIELKNNTDKSTVYSKNARLKALKRHNKERVVEQYIQIYKEVIKNHHT